MVNVEHQRPELRPTVIFDEEPALDPEPVIKNGRLLPGSVFSRTEYYKLVDKVIDNDMYDNTLRATQLPTLEQLYPLRLNPDGCWELPVYKDFKNRARYGRLNMPSLTTSKLAHRVMFLVFYGHESLDGDTDQSNLVVDHVCENKACCYPRHLEPVTLTTNTIRGILAKRHSDGQLGFSFGD